MKKNLIQTKTYVAIIVALSWIIIDQMSKYFIRTVFAFGESIPLLPRVLNITRIHNTGAAFGIFSHAQLIIAIVSLAIIMILFYYRTQLITNNASAIAFGLILGGALGNLIDRAVFGYVLDFIDFGFWPAFNLADTGITLGTITLIAIHLLNDRR